MKLMFFAVAFYIVMINSGFSAVITNIRLDYDLSWSIEEVQFITNLAFAIKAHCMPEKKETEQCKFEIMSFIKDNNELARIYREIRGFQIYWSCSDNTSRSVIVKNSIYLAC